MGSSPIALGGFDPRPPTRLARLLGKGQGPPDWYTEDLLDIYVSAETQDPRSVADLAFFRRRGQKRWKPVMSSVLRDHTLVDHEKVRALFDEPAGRLPALLPYTLGVLLRQALVQWPVPILALLDRAEVQESLNQFLSRLVLHT